MSTIKANTLLHSDGSTTTQPSIPALDQRMAKAWVVVNQTGTQAILNSYKVSSITDTGAGDTRMNFTETQPNADYCILVSGHKEATWDESVQYTQNTTTSVLLQTHTSSGAGRDVSKITSAIFG